MKKQLIVLFTLATIFLITLTSCEPFIQNKITIRNLAAGDVKLNLRGNLYDISAGGTLVLNDFKKGTFEYTTTYTLPAGATDFATDGDVSGQFILNAGTEVVLLYSSTLIDGKYTIYGALTTSDDVNRIDPFVDPTTP